MYKAEYVSVESGPEVHTSHSLLKVDDDDDGQCGATSGLDGTCLRFPELGGQMYVNVWLCLWGLWYLSSAQGAVLWKDVQ